MQPFDTLEPDLLHLLRSFDAKAWTSTVISGGGTALNLILPDELLGRAATDRVSNGDRALVDAARQLVTTDAGTAIELDLPRDVRD